MDHVSAIETIAAARKAGVVLTVAGYVVYRGRRWLARRRPAGPAAPES